MIVCHNPLHHLHHLHHLHPGRHEIFRSRLLATKQRSAWTVQAALRQRSCALRNPPDDGAFAFDNGLDAALARAHMPRDLHVTEQAWAESVGLDPANAGHAGAPDTPVRPVRSPGHHAGADCFGGYCFPNNATLAAPALRDGAAQREAVLDVDYHHGNGTQANFYHRSGVLTVSIHDDSGTEHPFFLGHADERGSSAGAGFKLNLPMPGWWRSVWTPSRPIRSQASGCAALTTGRSGKTPLRPGCPACSGSKAAMRSRPSTSTRSTC